MKAKKMKTSSDYPQFYCRMKNGDKAEIDKLIYDILSIATKDRGENDYKPRRNDYIVRGLRRGLKAILREMN